MMRRWLLLFLMTALMGSNCTLPPLLVQLVTMATKANASPTVTLELLGHVSGAATSMAFQDKYALLGFSYEMAVVDIADPAHPEWVTSLSLPANDIVLAGPYAYVVGRAGFAIVDMRDPAQPVLLSTLALADTPSKLAVTVTYAYVAVYNDLYTIALIDPAHPYLIGSTRLADRIVGVAIVADKVYVVTEGGFYRLAMSSPAQPIVHTLLANERLSFGPVIVDGFIYFGSSAALWVKELASATAPHQVGAGAALDWIGDVAVVDGFAYLASGLQGLHVWDITDQAAAVEVGAYPTDGLTKGVVAHAGYVYTLDCDEGLRIFDGANPNALTTVGAFTPLGISYRMAVADAFAYVAAGPAGSLHQIALSNPDQVHTIHTHLTRNVVHDLAVVDDTLYLIVDGGVRVIDIATPTAARVVAFYPLPNVWGIAVADAYLYVSDPGGNLWLLDRRDPVKLTPIAYYPALGYAAAMTVVGPIAYLPQQAVGMRLLAVGATGKLTVVGRYPLAIPIYKIVVADGYAYLALGEQGLQVVDVTDPTHPRLVSRYATPGAVRDLAVQWPYLVLAAGDGGVRVLDITDPAQPIAVASYTTADCAHQVVSVDGVIYVAQPLDGLLLFALREGL